MKKLFRFLDGYRKDCVLAPLFKLLEATLELIVPLIVAAIIDVGIAGGDGGYVLRMALLLVAFGLVGLVFAVMAQYFAAKAAVGFSTRTRHALYEHIGTLSYSELDTLGTSTIITRLTGDTAQVQTGINLTLRLLLRSPFVVFGAMIMAFTVDVPTALIFTATIPALAVVIFGIMLLSIPLYRKVQARLDRVLLKTRENLNGARVVRAFAKEDTETEEFRLCNGELCAEQRLVGRIGALLNPLTYVLINLAILWLIRTGALRVDAGILTQGAVIALYNYMSQILVELIKLANLIINITKSVASAKRIAAVLETKTTQVYGEAVEPLSSESEIECDGVAFRYAGAGADSLLPLSFRAKKGETIGIIGGTGAGKSTLVNLIARFYDATEGEIRIGGRPIREYSREALAKKIGIVPQRAVLFHGTIRENMRWRDESASDEEIFRALQIAQIADTVKEKGGLDYCLEEGGGNLSGGQKQRLSIARALVGRPEILILDDSSSALDYATDAALRRAIREENRESTILIVSQRTASLMHADKILVLDDAALVGEGTHEQLLRECEIYREIHESQFGKEASAHVR